MIDNLPVSVVISRPGEASTVAAMAAEQRKILRGLIAANAPLEAVLPPPGFVARPFWKPDPGGTTPRALKDFDEWEQFRLVFIIVQIAGVVILGYFVVRGTGLDDD